MDKINVKTVGADVELFLFNNDKNEVISAESYIKGSKYEPFNFDESNEFWTTSLDNVLAEFTIPPVKTALDFAGNLMRGIDYIKSILPAGISPIALPAANLNKKYLRTPQAQLFG